MTAIDSRIQESFSNNNGIHSDIQIFVNKPRINSSAFENVRVDYHQVAQLENLCTLEIDTRGLSKETNNNATAKVCVEKEEIPITAEIKPSKKRTAKRSDELLPGEHKLLQVPQVEGSFYRTNVLNWRMPRQICQQFLAGQTSSNACTLISVATAFYLYENGLRFPRLSVTFRWNKKKRSNDARHFVHAPCILPAKLMSAIGNAILDGNLVYNVTKDMYTKTDTIDVPVIGPITTSETRYSVEEAMELMAPHWVLLEKSETFYGDFVQNLSEVLLRAMDIIKTKVALSRWKSFFFILGTRKHASLIVYQPGWRNFCYVDSNHKLTGYSNVNDGMFVAMSNIEFLEDFCRSIFLNLSRRWEILTAFRLHWIAPRTKYTDIAKFAPTLPKDLPKMFMLDSHNS